MNSIKESDFTVKGCSYEPANRADSILSRPMVA